MAPDFMGYPFMREALALGLILGVLLSLMGLFVVTRGMSFFSNFVAHSAILGGALGLISGIDPTVFLIVFSLLVAFAASAVWNAFPLSRDTVLGVFFGFTVALGIILIAVKGLGQQSLVQFLLGDILLIRPMDIWLSAGLLAVFLVFFVKSRRKLIKSSFMPEISAAEGLNVKLYDYSLIALIAVTIALSIKLIGVILANAMVVIPAASAKVVSRSFRQFTITAPLIGVGSFLGGIVMSFYLDIPSGPSVITVASACFVLALIVRLARGTGP
jgi:ABC-type Mn2+/Zn2+ transport system permease subunit